MAQSNNIAATITKASGSISVERGGQTLTLNQGDSVYSTDTIKTQGASVELSFADGAKAILSPNSTMTVQEFAFNSGGESSFIVNLAEGAMRSISGKVVEQNPDAFKVVTPKATVGIRGTDFSVLNEGDALKIALHQIDLGHNLVATTYSGEIISLTTAGQGAFIGEGPEAKITPLNFTEQELKDIEESIEGSLGADTTHLEDEKKMIDEAAVEDEEKSKDDEERTAEEEKDTDTLESDTDQVVLLLDQGFAESLGEGNTSSLGASLGSGSLGFVTDDDSDLLGSDGLEIPEDDFIFGDNEDNDSTDNFTGGLDLDDDLDTDDDDDGDDDDDDDIMQTEAGQSFYGDGVDIVNSGTHNFGGQSININTSQDLAGQTISGDVHTINNTQNNTVVNAGDDNITGGNMQNGTVVGDAHTMNGGVLTSGDDNISLSSKDGGASIYGDVHTITDGTLNAGNDNIRITGNFSNTVASGDVNTVDASSGSPSVTWGDDTIFVGGDLVNAQLYGDYISLINATAGGGNDNITVKGSVDASSTIHGQEGNDDINVGILAGGTINAGAGSDDVTIGSVTGGTIDLGLNDGVTDNLNIGSATGPVNINGFDTDDDKLTVNGTEYDVSGDGNYGGVDLTFNNLSGNRAPTVTSNALTLNDANVPLVSGTIVITALDPDAGDTIASYAYDDSTLQYGTITPTGVDGQYTYTIDNSLLNIKSLGVGETLTDTMQVTVEDNNGNATVKEVTITINGYDDIHTVTINPIDNDVTEAGVGVTGDVSASGAISIADVDTNDVHDLSVGGLAVTTGTTYYVVDGGVVGYILQTAMPLNDAHVGTMTFSGSGKDFNYIFTLNNNNTTINAVSPGSNIQIDMNVSAQNQGGGNVSGTIQIDVNGSNDAPVVSAPGHVGTASGVGTNIGDTLTVNDPDTSHSNISSQILSASVTINGVPTTVTAPNAGATITINGVYGQLVLNGSTGVYSYIIGFTNAQEAAYKALGGSTITFESFEITSTDPLGASGSDNLSFALNGVDDPPEITSFINLSVTEAGVGGSGISEDQGSITVIDPDGDALTYSYTAQNNVTIVAGGASYNNSDFGTFTLNPDGSYKFVLNNSGIANTINNGDTIDLIYTITVSDGVAAHEQTQNVTVTITGTNDQPTLTLSDTSLIVTKVAGDTAVGTATGVDVDVSDTLDYGVSLAGGSQTTANSVVGLYGTLSIDDATGVYTYAVDAVAAAGATKNTPLTESFKIYVQDNAGTWTEQTIDVSVTGINQAPTITTSATDFFVIEAGVGRASNGATTGSNFNLEYVGDAEATGTLTVTDGDPTDTLTVSIVRYVLNSGASTTDPSVFAQYGTFEIIKDPGGWYNYKFTLNDNGIANQLAEGQRAELDYWVQVSDGVDIDEVRVQIVITGTNDKPTFTLSQDTLTITEDAAVGFVDGNITIIDIDTNDTHQLFVVEGNVGANDDETGPALTATETRVINNWGSFVVDAATNKYTFTLDPASADAQALGANETQDLYYTIYVQDNTGAWTSKVVTVTVTGTNDAPTLTLSERDPNVVEGTDTSADGTWTVDDVDTNDVQTITATGGVGSITRSSSSSSGSISIVGTYGTLIISANGNYTYTTGQTQDQIAALEALGGDTPSDTENFIIRTTDTNGDYDENDIIINVTGVNDAPIINVDNTGVNNKLTANAVGGSDSNLTGTISLIDPDSTGATYTVSFNGNDTVVTPGAGVITIVGTYGNLVINADGSYIYTLGVTQAQQDAVKAVGAVSAPDSTSNDEFIFTPNDGNVDGTTETLVIEVQGIDDAPTITVTPTDSEVTVGDVDDDDDPLVVSGDQTASGSFSIDDPDPGEISLSIVPKGVDADEYKIIGNTIITDYGTFIYGFNENSGQYDYTFTLDNSGGDLNVLGSISYTITSGGISQDIVITVKPGTASNAFDISGKDGSGDAPYEYDSADDSVTFKDNRILYDDNVSSSTIIAGDAVNFTGTSNTKTGGNDTIVVTGNVEGGSVYGDIHTAVGEVTGGNDNITIKGNVINGVIVGDANYLADVAGGADTIIVNGNLEGGFIFGEHRNGSSSNTLGGADTIIIGGNVNNNSEIYGGGGGDSISIGGDLETGLVSGGFGNDIITIKGDVGNEDGTPVTINGDEGSDTITVISNITSGTINGGADDDTINVNGVMTSGTITGGDGDDTYTVTKMSGGIIQGDAGEDTMNITDMSGGEVNGGEAFDIFTITNMTGGIIDGGDDVAASIDDSVDITNMTGGTIRGFEDIELMTYKGDYNNVTIELDDSKTNIVRITLTENSSITITNFNETEGDQLVLDSNGIDSVTGDSWDTMITAAQNASENSVLLTDSEGYTLTVYFS